MNIDIIAVGKLREPFYRDAAAEYEKRLRRYAKVNIIEVEEEKKSDSMSSLVEAKILEKEAAKIKKHFKKDSYLIVLAINGKQLSSTELADHMASIALQGNGTIQFVIGSAIGLSDEIIKEADYLLSFSKMTFPHQLMRVILLEQVYRSYRIIQGEPYHK